MIWQRKIEKCKLTLSVLLISARHWKNKLITESLWDCRRATATTAELLKSVFIVTIFSNWTRNWYAFSALLKLNEKRLVTAMLYLQLCTYICYDRSKCVEKNCTLITNTFISNLMSKPIIGSNLNILLQKTEKIQGINVYINMRKNIVFKWLVWHFICISLRKIFTMKM